MNINLQPILENDRIRLNPLRQADEETLYQAASDPNIWTQHPNPDRWKKEVFHTFFQGAMQSGGAFSIIDKVSGNTIGSTRFYDYRQEHRSIFIGYTFFACAYWGTGTNTTVKSIMLNYIFDFVDTVYFHIGAANIRSQKAIERIGADKIGEEEVIYFGELPRLNFVYRIRKETWRSK
ncbi:MAG: N-acetyltransferase [Chitinophagaceae bacterium]|nr:MAG: N-acetyltransferase [Chitinophagaceae bacterium]